MKSGLQLSEEFTIDTIDALLVALYNAPENIYKYYSANKKRDKERVNKRIAYLLRNDLVVEEDNKHHLSFKAQARALVKILENSQSKPELKNSCCLVFYDIPEELRSDRDALRQTLLNSGFRAIQKSVFISKRDCLKEVEQVVRMFELSRYVKYILVQDKQSISQL